jgi:hypothetical protein
MNNTVKFSYEQIHAFVEKNKSNGFFWDGYDVIKWSPGHNGFVKENGMYRNGKWGYSHRFTLNDDGTWSLPNKYVTNT